MMKGPDKFKLVNLQRQFESQLKESKTIHYEKRPL